MTNDLELMTLDLVKMVLKLGPVAVTLVHLNRRWRRSKRTILHTIVGKQFMHRLMEASAEPHLVQTTGPIWNKLSPSRQSVPQNTTGIKGPGSAAFLSVLTPSGAHIWTLDKEPRKHEFHFCVSEQDSCSCDQVIPWHELTELYQA
jgi:hypothetical protein